MATNRRDFLKLLGTIGAAGAVGGQAHSAPPASSARPDAWAMLSDLSLCIGCRKCEFACKQANRLPNRPMEDFEDEAVFEKTRRTDRHNLTVVNRFEAPQPGEKAVYAKIQCMHCNEPACASACPVAAIRKTRQGPVDYDPSLCIGCRYCLVACPFSMPAYTYDEPFAPAVRKCTMCFDAVSRTGGAPACAKICPVEATTFGTRHELLVLARDRIHRNPDKYVDHVYGEHEVGGTNWLYLAPKSFAELGFRTDLGDRPYPELTEGFLSAVPLVVAIWPALLLGAYALTKRHEAASRGATPPLPGAVELLGAERTPTRAIEAGPQVRTGSKGK
ncbi:MAG: 4Fe-4S dicluster domain-containing protein [Planctomycetes bacterium]|nr:4Fe-4S dicluster domain-containing protein [Planctomycetota bacterium]